MTSWRRHSLFCLVLIFAAVPVFASHSWGNYHWARTANSFTLKTGDNVSSAWDAYLDEAVADWSKSNVLALWKVAGQSNPKNCRATSGRIEVCNSKYGFNGWLGLAQIWASGSHITQAVAKMNDSYYNSATYNKPEWRRLVMCQEIGHDFGLDHQDENQTNPNLGTCMDYTNNPLGPPSNEHPNAHDYDQIAAIYKHLDGTSTIGMQSGLNAATDSLMVPVVAPGDDLDEPWRWGTPVRWDGAGRPNAFVLNLGGHGDDHETVITHVTWAPVDIDGPQPDRARSNRQ